MAAPEPATTTRTTCPYCGVGCGVVVERGADGAHAVRGDAAHPANLGRLCSKGAALAETLDVSDRLLAPRVGGARTGRETGWDEALGLVAARFRDTIDRHGPDAVALYVSGQLLTEDYYVANKLVKGWLGNANIDTNSRLCMASSVAGHVRAFGTDTVPGSYEDLELADLVVLVGSNLAWCHPVLFQRLQAAREARPDMRIVLIDPRRTATAELADVHLAIRPDSDLALFGALLRALDAGGAIDRGFADAHLDGLDEALDSVRGLDVAAAARLTGLEPSALDAFLELFVSTDRVVTIYSQGVNQGARGTDTVNAILDCHLTTNRIGRPGCGPFSVTGQPNAMGGREVGGLASTLAAHVALDDAAARTRVRDFWGSPGIADAPGPKAVELFERVRDGRVRAIWIVATNPVDSLPDADRVRAALAACPFVVVSDVVPDTDTAALAHVLLPSAAWSEKDGTVTNSERRISRQRAFRPPPGEARPDWWQLAEVAKRLGFERTDGAPAFEWSGPADVFREHAALSTAAGSADFDIGAAATLDDAAYDALAPFRWPWRAGTARAETRFFADGAFHTSDGRARVWPIAVDASPPRAVSGAAPKTAREVAPDAVPDVILNTGRVRDQWHTMTRTGRVARLAAHLGEPFAEIAPADAEARGIGPADIVELDSATGRVLVRALVTARQRPGSVFVPMHWSDAWASVARVGALVSATLDPVSGQPASKSERVRLARWPAASFGFVALAVRPDADALGTVGAGYWALAPSPTGWRLEVASREPVPELVERLETMCRTALPDAAPERAAHADAARGLARAVLHDGGRPVAAIYAGPAPVDVARRWVAERIGERAPDGAAPRRLLAGRAAEGDADAGAIVCGCFDVGARTLDAAIAASPPTASVADIGRATRAGTNCGSCRPEIARMLGARTTPSPSGPPGPPGPPPKARSRELRPV